MVTNGIQLIIDNFKEQFSLIRRQLDETKDDLSNQIKDIRSDIRVCLLRITEVEKNELILQIKAERDEKITIQKRNTWATITRAIIFSIVPILFALFYSVFKLAAKMNIKIF